MSERELERLADLIAQKAIHPPICIAFTPADIEGIKALAGAYNEGAKSIRKGIISIIVLGAIVVFCIGVVEYIKSMIKP